MKTYILAFFAVTMLALGCTKDQFVEDREDIEAYLDENSIDAEYDEEGYYFKIENAGTGNDHPNIASNVEVRYKGYLLDGSVFDQTENGETLVFPLAGLVPGWQLAIPKLKRGGSGTFYFPSALGYGRASRPGIPANSPLIFEIDLVDFEN